MIGSFMTGEWKYDSVDYATGRWMFAGVDTVFFMLYHAWNAVSCIFALLLGSAAAASFSGPLAALFAR